MNNFFKILLRYHYHILFFIIEIVAFVLMVNHNSYQGSVYFGALSSVRGAVNEKVYTISRFFSTAKVNETLNAENVELRNQLASLPDSIAIDYGYTYSTAAVINASWNKNKNYLVINKGRRDSIGEDMGVCSGNNVVGIITKSSEHYSIVMPLINTKSRISGMIKNNRYFGSLQWDGADYRYSYLYDIPDHISISKGDTVITSGSSHIFPEGKILGVVDSIIRQESSFYKLKVKLATNYKYMGDVNIVSNNNYAEVKALENEFLKDE